MQLEGLVGFTKVNNSKMEQMWMLLQNKQVCETFKKTRLDSTRGLGERVLGHIIHRKASESFYLRDSVVKQELPSTNSRHKIRVKF